MFDGKRWTEIEENFFGAIDLRGKIAVEEFARFAHTAPWADGAFRDLLMYMSTQRLRTPRGLAWLRKEAGDLEKFFLLFQLQQWRSHFAAIWTECVWQIADASLSPTKFIISDHPVTTYHRDLRPRDRHCSYPNDPDIRMHGTHTIFPLSDEKILILTNRSWARNPYQRSTALRPNPNYERDAIMFIGEIQIGRHLSEQEVREINFILKRRAHRYIAAAEEEWLYPEKHVELGQWNKFGHGYLCMPDPRSMTNRGGILMGLKSGGSDAFDTYGRKPWQRDFDLNPPANGSDGFYNFQGEFARLFGPKRRGRAINLGSLDSEEDNPSYHAYHLRLEKRRRR